MKTLGLVLAGAVGGGLLSYFIVWLLLVKHESKNW